MFWYVISSFISIVLLGRHCIAINIAPSWPQIFNLLLLSSVAFFYIFLSLDMITKAFFFFLKIYFPILFYPVSPSFFLSPPTLPSHFSLLFFIHFSPCPYLHSSPAAQKYWNSSSFDCRSDLLSRFYCSGPLFFFLSWDRSGGAGLISNSCSVVFSPAAVWWLDPYEG